ncbi:hypothetical protein HID58_094953 [Brassica napus]|uniref:ALOG domain-containing protein n=1 Tax=Brassica napus TaxID=3708 RepID=A0ABQ7X5E2_BRANA|nr:hypothetical protein HID58_094953 [Brassica napus]
MTLCSSVLKLHSLSLDKCDFMNPPTSGTTVLRSLSPRAARAHVLEFLRYLDQFAWGSLDALIGRLRAAYEENGGPPEANPSPHAPSGYTSVKSETSRPKLATQPPLPLQQQQPQQGQSVMANYSGAIV